MLGDPSSPPLPTKGGGGGNQPNGGSTYNPADAADVLKSRNSSDRSNLLGIDLKTGTVSETSPASIETGNGGFPYSLTASFDWKAGPPADSAEFGLLPDGQPVSGQFIPNWYNNLALSGSGMEGMGSSDIKAAAASIAAFVAEQDIYTTTDLHLAYHLATRRIRRADAGVVRAPGFGNVATVSVGKTSRQFVKLPDNSWFEPGPSYATMTMSGTRNISEAMCPAPITGQPNFALSRGWNYNQVSFAITNTHGDVENFGFWVNHYPNGLPGNCARRSGFRLNTWTFPQGMTVTVNYDSSTANDSNIRNVSTGPFPASSQPLGEQHQSYADLRLHLR